MDRRFPAAVTLSLFSLTLMATPCSAQGLLRRLQGRIESRIESVLAPVTADPAASGAKSQNSTPAAPTPAAPTATGPLIPLGTAPQGSANRTRSNSSTPTSASPTSASPTSASPSLARPRLVPPAGNPFGNSILAGPASERPTLGIQVLPDVAAGGLSVTGIDPHSLADEAGLREGDVIVAIDDTPTPTVAAVASRLKPLFAGDRVSAKVVRGSETTEVMIPLVMSPSNSTTLAPLPPPSPQIALEEADASPLGITANPSSNRRGLMVESVAAGSPAANAGIEVGDRIVSVGGKMMSSQSALDREFQHRESDETLSITLVRDGALIAADVSTRPIDPAAVRNGEPPVVASDDGEANSEGSVLGGFGSVLGGLFGSGGGSAPKNTNDQAAAATPPNDDVMAFADGEPIEQAVFESQAKKVPIPESSQEIKDPPSLKSIESDLFGQLRPIEQSTVDRRDQAIAELRAEVEELRKRLKELETKDPSAP